MCNLPWFQYSYRHPIKSLSDHWGYLHGSGSVPKGFTPDIYIFPLLSRYCYANMSCFFFSWSWIKSSTHAVIYRWVNNWDGIIIVFLMMIVYVWSDVNVSFPWLDGNRVWKFAQTSSSSSTVSRDVLYFHLFALKQNVPKGLQIFGHFWICHLISMKKTEHWIC